MGTVARRCRGFEPEGDGVGNYRKIMELVLEGRSCNEIVEAVGCSRRDLRHRQTGQPENTLKADQG